MATNQHLATGTLGGTFLAVMVNMNASDLLRTAILAAVGAVVSFTVSLSLKWIIKKFK